jgi:hypothetical protein
MGNTAATPRSSDETDVEKLQGKINSLEIDAALVRKKQAAARAESRTWFKEGHAEAAKARYQHAAQYKKQELQLINTITMVQRHILNIESSRLGKEGLNIMKSAARALHATTVDAGDLDRVSEAIHDRALDANDVMDRIAEHGMSGDDDDWDCFVASMDEAPAPLQACAAPTEPLPAVPPYTEETTPLLAVDTKPRLAMHNF